MLAFVAVTQTLVAEPPTFLLASGNVPAALRSARRIGGWNGVEPDTAPLTAYQTLVLRPAYFLHLLTRCRP